MADTEELFEDGYQTLIEFEENTDISLAEIEVTPPGVDAGGGIDTTTMRNEEWRTMAAKHLKSLTSSSFTAAYKTISYTQIITMIGVNQVITLTFPDGGSIEFWGFLNTFTPGAHVEGERPTAECEIIPTLKDDDGVEVEPVINEPV